MQALLDQRSAVASLAFPHNVWRICNVCVAQRIAVRGVIRSSNLCQQQLQQHYSRDIACPSATSGEDAGELQQIGKHGVQPSFGQQQGGVPQPAAVFQNLTPPVQPRPAGLLSWLPPQLVTHLQALFGFLMACWELLPEFVSPALPEAMRRLCLVLAASLVMVVVVSTIDSGWLYLYLLNARKVLA